MGRRPVKEHTGKLASIQRRMLTVFAPATTWLLLAKLLVIINYKLVLRGEPQINFAKLLGTILTHYTATLGCDIEKDFNAVRQQVSEASLPLFFSPDELDAIASCTTDQFPYAIRFDWRRANSPIQRKAARATLRRFGGKPTPPDAGLVGTTFKVRRRDLGAAAETYRWVREALGTFGDGEGPAG